MSRPLLLENPTTGAVKPFRPGFDWILFLFSGVLGIPLFLRGLRVWGGVFVGLWAVDLLAVWLAHESWRLPIEAIVAAIFFGLQIYLGWYGRELIVKAHLAHGWRKQQRPVKLPRPRRDRKQRP